MRSRIHFAQFPDAGRQTRDAPAIRLNCVPAILRLDFLPSQSFSIPTVSRFHPSRLSWSVNDNARREYPQMARRTASKFDAEVVFLASNPCIFASNNLAINHLQKMRAARRKCSFALRLSTGKDAMSFRARARENSRTSANVFKD